MPLVSVTRLRLRSWRFLPAFFFSAIPITKRARQWPGNLGYKVTRGPRNAMWTCTCWDSEASMREFMLANPHGPAMRKLLEWCDEASVVHWLQESREMPTWREAHRRLQADGRPSKVNHPSEAHQAYRVEAPE